MEIGMTILLIIYISILLGHHLALLATSFIRPRGLWLLVPFRVSGWRDYACPGKIYPVKWFWEHINQLDDRN